MEAYGRNRETKENVLIPVLFQDARKLSFHISADDLSGFTSAQKNIATITAGSNLYNYFEKIQAAGMLSTFFVPYTFNYKDDSMTSDTSRTEIHNIDFTFGSIKVSKDGNDYKISIEWGRKPSASFTLENGIYADIYALFPIFEP